jgi:DNA-binding transcriptional MerR regulator
VSKSTPSQASIGSQGKAEAGPAASATTGAAGELYRTREVVALLGISRRQLQYWAQTDLVVPSLKTRGGHHRYSFEDLVALKATKQLIDAGVSVQKIRKSIATLRGILPTVERPLSELVLVATGDIVLIFLEGTAFEAVSGQEWVFEVAQFQREVETWKGTSRAKPVRTARTVRRQQEQIRTA